MFIVSYVLIYCIISIFFFNFPKSSPAVGWFVPLSYDTAVYDKLHVPPTS